MEEDMYEGDGEGTRGRCCAQGAVKAREERQVMVLTGKTTPCSAFLALFL